MRPGQRETCWVRNDMLAQNALDLNELQFCVAALQGCCLGVQNQNVVDLYNGRIIPVLQDGGA